jgi:hypothetical protein
MRAIIVRLFECGISNGCSASDMTGSVHRKQSLENSDEKNKRNLKGYCMDERIHERLRRKQDMDRLSWNGERKECGDIRNKNKIV